MFARFLMAVALLTAATACGSGSPAAQPSAAAAAAGAGFRSGECNKVSDDEVKRAVGTATPFKKVVDGDAGCFWQEDSMLGTVGAGMGISTWWYRGSDCGSPWSRGGVQLRCWLCGHNLW